LDLEVKLAEGDRKMLKAKQAGDLLVYIWFSRETVKARNEYRNNTSDKLTEVIQPGSAERKAMETQRAGQKPVAPFHWELEFPEIFLTGGFSVVLGNPPFAGTNTILNGNPKGYLEYLLEVLSPVANGRCDLVGHFFNRAFSILKPASEQAAGGTMALIATKTVRQGKTREGSLSQICLNGGRIYYANRRVQWPGKAAVVIATLAASRGAHGLTPALDGKPVSRINSFLIEADIEITPSPLSSNAEGSYEGTKISGPGFTFEDDNPKASPLSLMTEILHKNPSYRSLIKTYVGGEQVNNQPVFSPERYVIDFGEMTRDQASIYKELWEIVEGKVKPERALYNRERNRDIWWQFAETRPGLNRAIKGKDRVLVANSKAAKYLTFSFLPNGCVYADSLKVFADSSSGHFAVLQSRVHEVWARLFGSSLEDRLTYNNADCYENYPFPAFSSELEKAGMAFDQARADVMANKGLGLTPLGNRLNDPDEYDPEILNLRELHSVMDKAVLDAYGWSDIVTAYEFSGDYENEDGSLGSVRLNFIEEVRDEILRRLLALHADRIAAQRAMVLSDPVDDARARKTRKPKKSKDSSEPELF
jgi:hypothetical protein